jgi:hypothetical protein
MQYMQCKVFVSCGQNTQEERQIAKDICSLLESLGFATYLAINVQTITEINTGIIRELTNSDAYLLVNFRRERIEETGTCRGSLFSNQELAIAFAFGFERLLIVNQDGVASEGMLRYIANNTETFHDVSDCCAAVRRAVERARWTPDYSRRLHTGELRPSDTFINYGGQIIGRFFYLDIVNDRPDIAALEATARLVAFGKVGTDLTPSPIRSPLKATGRPGFSHTIFPKSHEAFDLLCIGRNAPVGSGSVVASTQAHVVTDYAVLGSVIGPMHKVFLNCALDVFPVRELPITPGVWILHYEVFAIDFPVLRVFVELTFPTEGDPTAKVVNETS